MGFLDDKVAVVTGAGRGIGRGIAIHLAREGASVIVNDLGGSVRGDGTDQSVAGQVVDEIISAGGRAASNSDSVASLEGGKKIIQSALDQFGRIDILVNNAGILRDQFFHHMSEEDWDSVVNVHLQGSFYCTRAALPHMRRQKWGRILHITSTAGFIGTIAQANYGAAKMGLIGMSSCIALEAQPYQITSNCIAPFAWTRIPASLPTMNDEAKQIVDRLFKDMTPEDISPLIVFLASEEAKEITGQILGVRGKEIYIFSQPRILRSIHNAEGWTAEELSEKLESTFSHHFTPLDDSTTHFTWDALI